LPTGGTLTGGAPPTGGTPTGGAPPTGGATSACADSSTASGVVDERYGSVSIPTTGSKTYQLHANWWYLYNGQTLSYDGLGFSVNNQTSNSGNSGNPTG
jgi:hypothetical protein